MMSQILASIIIPVGPYHRDLYQRAQISAETQTIPSEVLVIQDSQGLGPVWARNRGAEQASGLFLVFLDADDWLEPDFVERCIPIYRPGHYVYTDHFIDDTSVSRPDCVSWLKGQWHAVTTLFPRSLFEWGGGWANVAYAEDSEFYLRMQSKGICGLHVSKSLVHYCEGGRRSRDFQRNPARESVLRDYRELYKNSMPCNNCPQLPEQGAANGTEKQPGDILAETLYAPARQMGRATQRFYPRQMYTGQAMWVDPRDVEAMPELWRKKFMPENISPAIDDVLALAKAALESA